MSWGVFEETDDEDFVVAMHVIPMIKINGELMRSAAHEISSTCPCLPLRRIFANSPIPHWNHRDPDHDVEEEDQEVN